MKRAFDLASSLMGLIILVPALIIVGLLVKWDSKGPIFFLHERMGRNFVPFNLIKFRSMRVENSGTSITASSDQRITRLGRILRKTKIDELPQLVNVIKGDMSLVGPRPEVRKYVELFPEIQKIILSIRPGITDLAAIEGVNEEEVLARSQNIEETYVKNILPQKHALQIQYVKNQSLRLDLKILIRTLGAILRNLMQKNRKSFEARHEA